MKTVCDITPPLIKAPRFAIRLSPREYDVWELLAQGYSYDSSAAKLGVTPSTVGTYRRTLFQKLGVQSDVQATVLAVMFRVVDLEQPKNQIEISPTRKAIVETWADQRYCYA